MANNLNRCCYHQDSIHCFACYNIDTADLFHIVVLFKFRFVPQYTHTIRRSIQISLNMDSFPVLGTDIWRHWYASHLKHDCACENDQFHMKSNRANTNDNVSSSFAPLPFSFPPFVVLCQSFFGRRNEIFFSDWETKIECWKAIFQTIIFPHALTSIQISVWR